VAYAHRQRSAALRAKTKQPDFCGRSTTEPVLSPKGWNNLCRGQAPVQFGAIGFQSRCVIGAVPGTGHARGLRLGGSRDLRLRRLRDQGARWIGVGSMWSHRRYVRARRPTLRQEATAASRAVTTLTPHPPAPASGRGGGRVSISCAVTYVGNAGKALCAKQPNSRFFCKIPYPLRLDASSALIHGPM
jgi:hypothetical protein